MEIGTAGQPITDAMRQRLREAIDAANERTAHPQRSPVTTFVYGSYVDEPLMMATGAKGAATCRYLHANHLYSVAAVTDAAGAVVERYRYDAYGKRTVVKANGTVTETSAFGNVVGFTGYRIDTETGLSYARARMYSVELGRFVGRDPAGYVDGYGMYSAYFAPNAVDPTGMWFSKTWLRGPTHQELTTDALNMTREYLDLGDAARKRLRDKLIFGNVEQDSGQGFNELQRHFNSEVDTNNDNTAQWTSAFTQYLKDEDSRFSSYLGSGDCESAIKALGALTHSWQDYYAHAVARNGSPKVLRAGLNIGDPDNISPDIKPSSFSHWYNPFQEHTMFFDPAFSDEKDTRALYANVFVANKLHRSYLKDFLCKCPCWKK